MSTVQASAAPMPVAKPAITNTILHIAWLSIALGIFIELLLLLAAAGLGVFKSIQPFMADLVQKVSWATIVCVGLGFGKLATTLRPHLTGLLGFVAAPIGFNIARALHKSAEKGLGLLPAGAVGVSPFMLASLKAIEYLCLGILLGWLARKVWGGALAHFATGFGIAVVFGGGIVAVADWYSPAALPLPAVAARLINELVFPVGCAMVIFAAEKLSSQLRAGASAED